LPLESRASVESWGNSLVLCQLAPVFLLPGNLPEQAIFVAL